MPDKTVHYKTHRLLLGLIAVAMPILLLVFNGGFEKSLSAFYWTNAGDLFVGSLATIAMFLITYNGYDKADQIITNIAGGSILVLILFPTFSGSTFYLIQGIPPNVTGWIHTGSSLLTFSLLGIMSLTQFSKATNKEKSLVYRIIGISILSIIVSMLPVKILLPNSVLFFWQEVLIVWLFGASWVLKGLPLGRKEDE